MSDTYWDVAEARWAASRGPRLDLRDIVVRHTALLRELHRAPELVRRPPTRRARRHLHLLLDLLERQHDQEDALLRPLLDPRAPGATTVAAAEHAAFHDSIAAARAGLAHWNPALATALQALHAAAEAHLNREDRTLLPVVARHLTVEEWNRVGEAAAAVIPLQRMPMVFGMFAYKAPPDVLRLMLSSAPPIRRRLLPRIGPPAYRRHARRIYGTSTP